MCKKQFINILYRKVFLNLPIRPIILFIWNLHYIQKCLNLSACPYSNIIAKESINRKIYWYDNDNKNICDEFNFNVNNVLQDQAQFLDSLRNTFPVEYRLRGLGSARHPLYIELRNVSRPVKYELSSNLINWLAKVRAELYISIQLVSAGYWYN